MTVTETQEVSQKSQNGHVTQSYKSQSQYVTKKSADKREDCGR